MIIIELIVYSIYIIKLKNRSLYYEKFTYFVYFISFGGK